jgi:hypothetical protein
LHLLGYCLALLLALVIFYLPWLTNQQSFYLSDITYFYEPFCRFIGQAIKTNRLPLWNPFCFSGMPQIAVLAPGLFYPPTWFFALLPFSPAMATYMVLHQLVAGLGAFLLISSFGWGSLAAAIGATGFALGGYMFSLQKNFTLVASVSWLPLTLWVFARIDSKAAASRWLATVAASGLIFLEITAGRPELSLPSLISIGCYILVSAFNARRTNDGEGDHIRTLFLRSTSVVCGLLLSMPVILPTVEWLALSPRHNGLSQFEALTWSANWYDLIALFLAQPLGDLNLVGMKHLSLVATRPGFIPFLSSAFIGPVVLTLAIWAAFNRSWKARWLTMAVLLGSLIPVLGNNTPVFPWMVKLLPVLAIFRYPIKLIIVPVICLTLLASHGAYLALTNQVAKLERTLCWAIWLTVLVIGGLLTNQPELCAQLVSPHRALLASALALIGQSALISATIGLTVCFFAHLYWSERITARLFSAMLISTLTLNLLACAYAFSRHGAPANFFEQPSELGAKVKQFASSEGTGQRYRILPLYFDPLVIPPWCHQSTLIGNNPCIYQYGRQLLLPQTHMDSNLCSSFGYEAAETADYRQLFSSAYRTYRSFVEGSRVSGANDALVPLTKFCQLTATRYVFTQVQSDSTPPKPLPHFENKHFTLLDDDSRLNVRIYRLNAPLARAYLRSQWRWCDSQEEALALIDKTNFDPTRQLIIEHSSTYSSQFDPKLETAKAASPVRGWLQFMQDTPEHISLSVKVSAPCFLVLADHYYPGWLAKADGTMTQLYRANAIERAVYIPAGSHLVEFDYDPNCLTDGLHLAVLSLSVLAVMLAWVVFIKLAESIKGRAEG